LIQPDAVSGTGLVRDTMPGVPRPFVAYLRVYEPLSAFEPPFADRVRQRLHAGALSRSAVADRERELWLRSQLAEPPRLLPGDLANGRPAPHGPLDVLTISPSEVPTAAGTTVGPGPLVCPLDVRPRSAAALVGFLANSAVVLRDVAVPIAPETVRGRAAAVMAELAGGAVHVVSTTWTVPLPWFVLFEPASRHVVLAPRDSPEREVLWRAAMSDARARVAQALTVVKATIGDVGPVKILTDTARWLDHFHADSAVELDYGGLVQLLDDEELLDDSSVQDVQAIVAAMEKSDGDEVGRRYEKLREFWGELAARERSS
jgi:hypothetical protein